MVTQSKRALVPIAQVTLHAPFSWTPADSNLGDQVLGFVLTSAFYLNGDVKTARMVCGQETNAYGADTLDPTRIRDWITPDGN
jgi:hypothetical protein